MNDTPRVTPAELKRIAKRHGDIPQDGLFDSPTPLTKTTRKAKTLPSLAFAPCPQCHAPGNRLIGLIAHTEDAVIFRDHRRRVGKISMPCSGSGLVWEGQRYEDAEAGGRL